MVKNEQKMWVVRAGKGSALFDLFTNKGIAAINYERVGDITGKKTRKDIDGAVLKGYPERSSQSRATISSVHDAFCLQMRKGDAVMTYNKEAREYLVGTVGGDVKYQSEEVGYRHYRAVKWQKTVSRDDLPISAKNSLGSALTVFQFPNPFSETAERESGQVDIVSDDDAAGGELENAEVKIEDAVVAVIRKLEPSEMEKLVAALLRAMGYLDVPVVRSQEGKQSKDGGYDVSASPDGLMLKEPRIRVEVKHREGKMDVKDIRAFANAKGDARGIYVSTGGYTREAIVEARGSDIIMLDLTMLTKLIFQHYDNFDGEGCALLPMKKLYIPLA